MEHDEIVANMSFGFWVSLFHRHQYVLLGDSLLAIFPSLPRNKQTRQKIAKKLFYIKKTRNRIAHGKPIIFVNGKIDFKILDMRIAGILELTSLMEVDTTIYQDYLSKFEEQKKKIVTNYT